MLAIIITFAFVLLTGQLLLYMFYFCLKSDHSLFQACVISKHQFITINQTTMKGFLNCFCMNVSFSTLPYQDAMLIFVRIF